MRSIKDICHFCGHNYSNDNFTYLIEGPAHEASICEHCVKNGILLYSLEVTSVSFYKRCDVCGLSLDSIFFGHAPSICTECLHITEQLIESAKNER